MASISLQAAQPICMQVTAPNSSWAARPSAPATHVHLIGLRPSTTGLRFRGNRTGHIVAMATPPNINDKLSQSIKEAEEVCAAENATGECAAAWDEVEELSAEIAHKRVKTNNEKLDPLEEFCKDAPEADECRVYED